jgi:hypothetical protein
VNGGDSRLLTQRPQHFGPQDILVAGDCDNIGLCNQISAYLKREGAPSIRNAGSL